jgi:hypothetical protein
MFLSQHFAPVLSAVARTEERLLGEIDQGSPIAKELTQAIQEAGQLVVEMVGELQNTRYSDRSEFHLWEHRRRLEAFTAAYVADMNKAKDAGFFAIAAERQTILKLVSRVFSRLSESLSAVDGVLEIGLRGEAWDRQMAEERKIMDEHFRLQEEQITAMKERESRLLAEARDRMYNHERRMAAAGVETDDAQTLRLRKERDAAHREQAKQ